MKQTFLLAIFLALVACSHAHNGTTGKAATHEITGTANWGGSCLINPYTGLNVVVTDGTGVVGKSTLQVGQFIKGDVPAPGTYPGYTDAHFPTYAGHCSFPFAVQVPDKDSYQIVVGQSRPVPFSKDALEADNWNVALFEQ